MSSQVQAANQNLRSPGGQVPHGESQRGLRCVYPGSRPWKRQLARRRGSELRAFRRAADAERHPPGRGQTAQLHARQQRLLLDIELGVRRTWLELEDAKQRLEVTSQTIGQAQESLREIEQRYRGQIATITQLVDSQVAPSNAMVRRTTSLAEVEIARAALEQATGRLRDVIRQTGESQ